MKSESKLVIVTDDEERVEVTPEWLAEVAAHGAPQYHPDWHPLRRGGEAVTLSWDQVEAVLRAIRMWHKVCEIEGVEPSIPEPLFRRKPLYFMAGCDYETADALVEPSRLWTPPQDGNEAGR